MSTMLNISKLFLLIERQAFKIEKWVCIFSLAAMLLAVSASVIVRYFNLPLPDFSEIALFAMSPLTFVGMAMCSYKGAHIVVDIISHIDSPVIRQLSRIVVAIAMIVFGVVYFTTSLDFYQTTVLFGERGLGMGIPLSIPTFFFPFGMALVVFHAVAELFRAVIRQPSVFEEFS